MSDQQTGTALAAPTAANFLDVIRRAAMDPSVDVQKMHGLLDVQERMMNKQAEIEFNIAFTKLQNELPRIRKDASIVFKGKVIAKYAKYETIDDVIRPLLIKNGFALRFNSGPNGNQMIMECTLSHSGGHSVTDRIPLQVEKSGAMNSAQSAKSTVTYGKRTLVEMMLNLVFEGEDDDGQNTGFIPLSDEQAEEIKELMRLTNSDVERFLQHFNAPSVDEMDGRRYIEAINTLKTKLTRMNDA